MNPPLPLSFLVLVLKRLLLLPLPGRSSLSLHLQSCNKRDGYALWEVDTDRKISNNQFKKRCVRLRGVPHPLPWFQAIRTPVRPNGPTPSGVDRYYVLSVILF